MSISQQAEFPPDTATEIPVWKERDDFECTNAEATLSQRLLLFLRNPRLGRGIRCILPIPILVWMSYTGTPIETNSHFGLLLYIIACGLLPPTLGAGVIMLTLGLPAILVNLAWSTLFMVILVQHEINGWSIALCKALIVIVAFFVITWASTLRTGQLSGLTLMAFFIVVYALQIAFIEFEGTFLYGISIRVPPTDLNQLVGSLPTNIGQSVQTIAKTMPLTWEALKKWPLNGNILITHDIADLIPLLNEKGNKRLIGHVVHLSGSFASGLKIIVKPGYHLIQMLWESRGSTGMIYSAVMWALIAMVFFLGSMMLPPSQKSTVIHRKAIGYVASLIGVNLLDWAIDNQMIVTTDSSDAQELIPVGRESAAWVADIGRSESNIKQAPDLSAYHIPHDTTKNILKMKGRHDGFIYSRLTSNVLAVDQIDVLLNNAVMQYQTYRGRFDLTLHATRSVASYFVQSATECAFTHDRGLNDLLERARVQKQLSCVATDLYIIQNYLMFLRIRYPGFIEKLKQIPCDGSNFLALNTLVKRPRMISSLHDEFGGEVEEPQSYESFSEVEVELKSDEGEDKLFSTSPVSNSLFTFLSRCVVCSYQLTRLSQTSNEIRATSYGCVLHEKLIGDELEEQIKCVKTCSEVVGLASDEYHPPFLELKLLYSITGEGLLESARQLGELSLLRMNPQPTLTNYVLTFASLFWPVALFFISMAKPWIQIYRLFMKYFKPDPKLNPWKYAVTTITEIPICKKDSTRLTIRVGPDVETKLQHSNTSWNLTLNTKTTHESFWFNTDFWYPVRLSIGATTLFSLGIIFDNLRFLNLTGHNRVKGNLSQILDLEKLVGTRYAGWSIIGFLTTTCETPLATTKKAILRFLGVISGTFTAYAVLSISRNSIWLHSIWLCVTCFIAVYFGAHTSLPSTGFHPSWGYSFQLFIIQQATIVVLSSVSGYDKDELLVSRFLSQYIGITVALVTAWFLIPTNVSKHVGYESKVALDALQEVLEANMELSSSQKRLTPGEITAWESYAKTKFELAKKEITNARRLLSDNEIFIQFKPLNIDPRLYDIVAGLERLLALREAWCRRLCALPKDRVLGTLSSDDPEIMLAEVTSISRKRELITQIRTLSAIVGSTIYRHLRSQRQPILIDRNMYRIAYMRLSGELMKNIHALYDLRVSLDALPVSRKCLGIQFLTLEILELMKLARCVELLFDDKR